MSPQKRVERLRKKADLALRALALAEKELAESENHREERELLAAEMKRVVIEIEGMKKSLSKLAARAFARH